MLGKFRTLYTRGISLHDLTIGGPSKKLFFLSLACDDARRCFALGPVGLQHIILSSMCVLSIVFVMYGIGFANSVSVIPYVSVFYIQVFYDLQLSLI